MDNIGIQPVCIRIRPAAGNHEHLVRSVTCGSPSAVNIDLGIIKRGPGICRYGIGITGRRILAPACHEGVRANVDQKPVPVHVYPGRQVGNHRIVPRGYRGGVAIKSRRATATKRINIPAFIHHVGAVVNSSRSVAEIPPPASRRSRGIGIKTRKCLVAAAPEIVDIAGAVEY